MQQSDRPSMIFMLNALRMSNFREQKRFFRPGSNCPINRNVANRKNNKRIGTPVFNLQNTCTVDGLNRRLKSRKTLRPSFPVQLSPCFSKYFSADEKPAIVPQNCSTDSAEILGSSREIVYTTCKIIGANIINAKTTRKFANGPSALFFLLLIHLARQAVPFHRTLPSISP